MSNCEQMHIDRFRGRDMKFRETSSQFLKITYAESTKKQDDPLLNNLPCPTCNPSPLIASIHTYRLATV